MLKVKANNTRFRNSASTASPKNIIAKLPSTARFENFVKNGEWYMVSGFLHESVVNDETPTTYPVTYPAIPYRSQWAVDADGRDSDCGQACTAMLCQSLGVYVPINALPYQSDQAGYTTAQHLVQNAASVGISLKAVNFQHLEDVPLPAIWLVDYAKFPNSEVQDAGFNGLHWLVVLEFLPDGGLRVNDPDYWGNRINEGKDKVYSATVAQNALKVSGVYQTVVKA